MSELMEEIVKVITLIIVEFIFNILFILIFCDVIGRYTRYGFLRFIGQKVTVGSLSTINNRGTVDFVQAFFNSFSAIALFAAIFAAFVYLK